MRKGEEPREVKGSTGTRTSWYEVATDVLEVWGGKVPSPLQQSGLERRASQSWEQEHSKVVPDSAYKRGYKTICL